jgi:hypothetical protein
VKAAKIEGMKELEKAIKKLEKLPQTTVTKSARKGATIAQKSSKKGGWVDQTGNLRKGIVLKGEKAKVKGKKVYQITMDSKMNDIFQKETSSGTTTDNKTGREKKGHYYYPASQEYGFRTRNGGYVPGFHFLRDGIVENKPKIEKTIIETLSKEIDKL